MIKRIYITVFNFFILSVSSQRCFIMTDVMNSQSLFTYQGNVYDIVNYVHPGGRTAISQVVGTALEPFLQQPRYSFHLTSNRFRNDLPGLIVGILRDNCQPIVTTVLPPPILTTIAPLPILTTIAPIPIVTTIPSTPIITTIVPPPITTSGVPPPVITTVFPTNCIPQNLDLNVSYNQQNLIADYNINNIYQDLNYIKMSLLENIGGTRISSTNYIQYGKVDITMKTPKGFNVITSFYMETDNGEIVNFNIINKDTDKLSIIDTNFYDSNLDYNANSKSYDQPVILSETFTKYSLIKMTNYYEWQVNDVTLRVLNVNSTNNLSKIRISIWEAPPSVWGGPGIQWVMNPFDLLISGFNVNCSIMNNKSIDNTSEDCNVTVSDPNNSSNLNPNINLMILIVLFFIF